MRRLLLSNIVAISLGLGIVPSSAIPPFSLGAATAAGLAGGGVVDETIRTAPAEPPGVDVRTFATQVAPLPLLIVADTEDVRAAASLLDDVTSAGLSTAGVCLPLELFAGADAAIEQEVAGRLRPALAAHGTPACLMIRPPGPEARPEFARAIRATLAHARSILGDDFPIGEVRLDLSGHPISPVQAAAQAALVGQLAHEIAPEARLRVVLGGFSGVDAARPPGAGAYLTALDQWYAYTRASLPEPGPGVAGIDLALDDLPPRTAALAQDWARTRGMTAGVQLPGDPGSVERHVRPLLRAGGSAETLAVRLALPGESESGEVGAQAVGSPLASFAGLRRADILPHLELRDAPALTLPGPEQYANENASDEVRPVDSNSPAHWDGESLYVFTSVAQPRRSEGSSLFDLGPARPVRVRGDGDDERPMRWLEATYKADDGTLYGWYHEEPTGVCPAETDRPDVALTMPRIGAMSSEDDGRRWRDLGTVLEAPSGARRCDTANRYFAGGVGDFSVIPDRSEGYLYLVFSSFGPEPDQQGIGLARISRPDLDEPVGAVWRWSGAGWTEPGIGGRATMLYPATTDWHRPDANAFWGPTIHWNTYLDQYVLLLNRAGDADWSQAGAYVAFAANLDEPLTWTVPQRLRDGGNWYVQAMGTDTSRRETDTLIGRTARYFEHGVSRHELVFRRPGE